MKAWKPILAALVIFITGVVTGGIMLDRTESKPTRMLQRNFPYQRGPHNPDNRPGSRMEGQLNSLMERIQSDIKLTDEQAAKVELAFKSSREEMKTCWDEMRRRMRISTKNLKDSLRTDLTEKQLEKIEKYLRPTSSRDRFKGNPRPGDRPGFRKRKNEDKQSLQLPPSSSEHP